MEKSGRLLPSPPYPAESMIVGRDEKQDKVASFRDLRPPVPRVELSSQGGIDVLAALRKRPLLALGVALACAVAVYSYLHRRTVPDYHAEASVYVSPTYFKNLSQDREQLQISYTTLVSQEMKTITRNDILAKALEQLQQQGIQWRAAGETDEATVARLGRELKVEHILDSYLVTIGLNGPRGDQLAPIVNTITQTYLQTEKDEDLQDRTQRMAGLNQEQKRVATNLQQKLDEQAIFQSKLTTLSLDKAATVDDTMLTTARQALEEAHRKRVAAETNLAILQASKDGSKNLLTMLAEDAATNDPNARPLFNSLIQQKVDLQKNTDGMTAENPLRQKAEKELVKIQGQETQLQESYTGKASERLLATAHSDVDRNRLLEQNLEREVDDLTSKVQSKAKQVQMAQTVNDDVNRLRTQQSAITTQIDALNVPGDQASYVRSFSIAQPPLAPNESNSKKQLFIVLALGLSLGLAVAVGWDLIDQRIFAPSEVKRAVGFLPVGIVLDPTPGTMAFAEEHLKRLANGIQRGMSTLNAKSIVLTPVRHAGIPGALISDIGRVLMARGLKTAIMDAHPRSSRRSDEPVNVSEQRSDRLALIDPADPRVPEEDPLLPARIEMGSSTDSGPAPFVSRISGLLEELEQEYDVVLIDAPALGLSADTEFLASISDITLLVAEAGEATRRELTRSASTLGRIGAPSVGVVMCHVRMNQAGGALKREFSRFSSLSWSHIPNNGQA